MAHGSGGSLASPARAAPLDLPVPPLDLPVPPGVCSTDTALLCAARAGLHEPLAALLHAGADVHAVTQFRDTALHVTPSGRAVAALLEAGAEVDARGDLHRTPLHHAALLSRPAVARALVAGGADPMARDAEGCTPLHLVALSCAADGGEAAASGSVAVAAAELVQVLTAARGCDVDAIDHAGRSALHYAARFNNLHAAGALLEAGAATWLRDGIAARTAATVAREHGHVGMAIMLAAYDADG